MDKRQKIRQDRRTIRKYEQQLKNRPKEHEFIAEGYSQTDRKSRAICAGECVLQALEKLYELKDQRERDKHPLLDGSLFWTVHEQKVKDTTGKKGFHYGIAFHVQSDEPYYTQEEINAELKETYRRIKAETEEMYGPVTDEEYLEDESNAG